jgi:hypothetical protein
LAITQEFADWAYKTPEERMHSTVKKLQLSENLVDELNKTASLINEISDITKYGGI